MPRVIVYRGLLLSLFWWVLAEGQTANWWLGALAVLLALWLSLRLLPASAPRLDHGALLGFLLYFIRQSLRSGLQVALLALRGRDALRPAILQWRIELPPGLPRVLLLNSLSLMPGTLGIELDDDLLRIHVLDGRLPVAADVATLQAHIARIYGAPT